MPKIAIIGSIIADIIVQTPRLPASGENLHVPRIQIMTGGKGANAAVAFTRLGGRAHLLGNVGADAFGQQARAALRAEGVEIAGVSTDPAHPTGAGILLVEPNGHTAFLIEPGANLTLTPAQIEAALRPLLPTLAGLLYNFEAPESCLLLAAGLARGQNVPLFVDAGPARPYSPALWRDAAILSPNQTEAAAILGYALDDDAAVIAAAHDLLKSGPRAVVLKLGARGALWADAEGWGWAPARPIQAVDTAGAGDAFTAGLTLALLEGQPLPAAVRFANACGALAASRLGTLLAMPWRAEVDDGGEGGGMQNAGIVS